MDVVSKQADLLSRKIKKYVVVDDRTLSASILLLKEDCREKCTILFLTDSDIWGKAIEDLYKKYYNDFNSREEFTGHYYTIVLSGSDLGSMDTVFSEGHKAIVGYARDSSNEMSNSLESRMETVFGVDLKAIIFNDYITDFVSVFNHALENLQDKNDIKPMYRKEFVMSVTSQMLDYTNGFSREVMLAKMSSSGKLELVETISYKSDGNSMYQGNNIEVYSKCTFEEDSTYNKKIAYGMIVLPEFSSFGEKISLINTMEALFFLNSIDLADGYVLLPYFIKVFTVEIVYTVIKQLLSENKKILFVIGGWE